MKREIRVLSVQHYPVFGGPHNEIMRLEPHLNRLGVKTIVAHTNEPGNALCRLQGLVEIHPLKLQRIRMTMNPVSHVKTFIGSFGEVAALRRLIREHDIDVVKVHGPHNPHAAVAARLERVPVVWVVSSTRVPRGFRTLGGHLIHHMANAVLVNGESLSLEYPGLEKCKDRIRVYYPPVPTDCFEPSSDHRESVRRELGIPPDAPVAGMVANINPQKGIEYFVRAAAEIAEKLPEARFVLVGSTYETQKEYFAKITQEITESGIAERIVLTGQRNDVARLYAAMDVKLITSVPRSEGTTTTAMEAMACGVPVVATNVGAVSEVVRHEVTGFVVPPGRSRAIAEASLQILEDAQLRSELSVAARQEAVQRFDSEICAATHLAIYELAIANHLQRTDRAQLSHAE